MSRLTIIGDPHIMSDNKDYAYALFDKIEALENNVIILGDVFHYKRMVQSDAFNLVFDRIRNSTKHFTILVGNHDYHSEDCKEHSLEPLKVLSNVTIIDQPREIKVGNAMLGFIPYTSDLERFRATIKDMADSVHCLFVHAGINNFDFGNGHVETMGINLAELEAFPLVIGGHLHKHQKEKNLVLLGTPKSHSHGEENQDKFIGILTPDTLELEFLPTDFPRHITLTYDCDSGEAFPEWDSKNHNRCILKGSEENVSAFDRTGKESIAFIPQPIRSGVEISIRETDSNEQKFLTWATEIKQLDAATTEEGVSILKNVL